MTITLEKIKEMNIPVGTPIEITINKFMPNIGVYRKFPESEASNKMRIMGYFYKVDEEGTWKDFLRYHLSQDHQFPNENKVTLIYRGYKNIRIQKINHKSYSTNRGSGDFPGSIREHNR